MSRRHTFELARRLTRALDNLPPRERSRALRDVTELDVLVEHARDDYLAELDADDGLAVLTIAAEEVIAAASEHARRASAPVRRKRRR